MVKKVIEASTAVAIAAKLCRPACIPMYPITPQTHIVERLADFINDGDLECEMIHVESEHSAISAAIGVSAAGERVFTATASQGLALMHEVLHVVSGMRMPVVMAVANRALSAPISIWNDHQDSISARDTGWIQLYVESSQEALDTTIMAFKIAEDHNILLPIMVCLDGFTLSHVWEPVDVPDQKNVDTFLPKFKSFYKLDPKKPVTMGPIGLPNSFMDFKKQQQDAMTDALKKIQDVNKEYGQKFKRSYGDGLLEEYKMEDAEYAIVALGTVCGTTRVVVDKLRKEGKKVGMIKLKSFRPFPENQIIDTCKKLKGVGIIDRNISIGHHGAVFSEIKSALHNTDIVINSFVAGLGGRDVTPGHIEYIFSRLNKQYSPEWMMVKK